MTETVPNESSSSDTIPKALAAGDNGQTNSTENKTGVPIVQQKMIPPTPEERAQMTGIKKWFGGSFDISLLLENPDNYEVWKTFLKYTSVILLGPISIFIGLEWFLRRILGLRAQMSQLIGMGCAFLCLHIAMGLYVSHAYKEEKHDFEAQEKQKELKNKAFEEKMRLRKLARSACETIAENPTADSAADADDAHEHKATESDMKTADKGDKATEEKTEAAEGTKKDV